MLFQERYTDHKSRKWDPFLRPRRKRQSYSYWIERSYTRSRGQWISHHSQGITHHSQEITHHSRNHSSLTRNHSSLTRNHSSLTRNHSSHKESLVTHMESLITHKESLTRDHSSLTRNHSAKTTVFQKNDFRFAGMFHSRPLSMICAARLTIGQGSSKNQKPQRCSVSIWS